MNSFDPTTAIIGGLLTSAAGEYMGVSSPMLALAAASIGGAAMSKIKSFYNTNKNVLPPIIKMNEMIDSLQSAIGMKSFSVIITKGENVVFNKVESYILFKYADDIVTGHVSEVDNSRLAFSVATSVFGKPLVDHFDGNRILLTVNNNQICLHSRTACIAKLKEYTAHIISLRLGTRTLSIHQPIITATKNTKTDDVNVSVHWKTFKIKTNKTFHNTILTDDVKKNLVDDLKHFSENEDYYNNKGIPYKRGYLLHGPPGTGKTSIIKAIASHYGMDIFLINMGEVTSEKELTMVFQGTRSCRGYHMLCFEDIDRCAFLQSSRYEGLSAKSKSKSTVRTFINELDGVIENPKRITILTANNIDVIKNIPALIRPGRIDKSIKLDYCTPKQINGLYNHFSDNTDTLDLKSIDVKITPAQVVKYILSNPLITADEIKANTQIISKISVSDKSIVNNGQTAAERKLRSRKSLKRRRRNKLMYAKKGLIRMQKSLVNIPTQITKQTLKIEKLTIADEKRKGIELRRKKAKKIKDAAKAKKASAKAKKAATKAKKASAKAKKAAKKAKVTVKAKKAKAKVTVKAKKVAKARSRKKKSVKKTKVLKRYRESCSGPTTRSAAKRRRIR